MYIYIYAYYAYIYDDMIKYVSYDIISYHIIRIYMTY